MWIAIDWIVNIIDISLNQPPTHVIVNIIDWIVGSSSFAAAPASWCEVQPNPLSRSYFS
jgi:hypothetical protein